MVHFVLCKRHLHNGINSSTMKPLSIMATEVGEEMRYIVPKKQEATMSCAQIIQGFVYDMIAAP